MDAKYIGGMINSPTLHPNDAVNRWIAAILLFDFELVHIPALRHTGADGLSRRPQAPEDPPRDDGDELEEWIDRNAGFYIDLFSPSTHDPILSLLQAHVAKYHVFPVSASVSPSVLLLFLPPTVIPRTPKARLREKKLVLIRQFLQDFRRPADYSDEQYRLFIRQATQYFFYEGNLYRKNQKGNPQLVPKPEDRLELIQLRP